MRVKKRAVQKPASDAGRTLQDSDIAFKVFEYLPADALLLCTMVCRGFRRTIDEHVTAEFERPLRWRSVELSLDSTRAHFDAARSAMVATVYVQTEAEQHMWLLNVIPKVGNNVHMRRHMYLPLESVHVSGDAKRVEKIVERQLVSIDVLRWKIVEIKVECDGREGAPPSTVGLMRLCASSFSHNSPVKLRVDHDIIVDFYNVPVARQTPNYRSLCVMKCVRSCMHCFQRRPKWQSADVGDSDHRVICSICYEALYVAETQLKNKWKVRRQVPIEAVSRASFVWCAFGTGAPYRVYPDIPVKCMLKQQVAEFLGSKNWTELLKDNQRHARAPRNQDKKFSFAIRWF
jgi:hypothetical protein